MCCVQVVTVLPQAAKLNWLLKNYVSFLSAGSVLIFVTKKVSVLRDKVVSVIAAVPPLLSEIGNNFDFLKIRVCIFWCTRNI